MNQQKLQDQADALARKWNLHEERSERAREDKNFLARVKAMSPEEVDRVAKRDQAAIVERYGGREAILKGSSTGATPTPGHYADDSY